MEACLYGIRIIIRNKVKKGTNDIGCNTYGKTCNNFAKTWLATRIICYVLLHGLYVYGGGAEISGTR